MRLQILKSLVSHFKPRLRTPNIQTLVTTHTHVLFPFSGLQQDYISRLPAVSCSQRVLASGMWTRSSAPLSGLTRENLPHVILAPSSSTSRMEKTLETQRRASPMSLTDCTEHGHTPTHILTGCDAGKKYIFILFSLWDLGVIHFSS